MSEPRNPYDTHPPGARKPSPTAAGMTDEITNRVVDAVFDYLDKDILNGY